jgi:hypothetical protein
MKNLKINTLLNLIFCLTLSFSFSQGLSVEQMKSLTSNWDGERFDDGRPKVSTNVLREEKCYNEEAWGV